MTDKELERLLRVGILLAGLILGLVVGGFITGLRYDSEIRTDQLVLKDQVEEIMADRAVIADLISELLLQVESVKAERKALEELKIILSKGE